MKFEEFKTIVITLKAAFPTLKAFDTDEGIRTWYEMIKDLDYGVAAEATAGYIRESPYPPTVADIRSLCRKIVVPDWSFEWCKLLKGAKLWQLNTPAQYAVKTMTEEYVHEMIGSCEKVVLCMKEFERLYNNYFHLTEQDKSAFRKLGIWKNEDIGLIEMRQLSLPDGRKIQ
ncbi:hypothetical protein LK537_25480 [Lachnoclostridium pacaense]|uniref:replicative helicase loader/inhibitor n=1 Tax=Enterocloster hominis (ex Hitch et al. 2024) TaxID=1917870 RepID=UPI001D12654B|nr:replicative helicase loader/inhibitor [Lachnoclostridium pacaense]MCC2820664.1 hypothetical protein [Lachnoclostridium pacaense]